MDEQLRQHPCHRREAIDQYGRQLHERRFQGRRPRRGDAGITDLHQVILPALGDLYGKLRSPDEGREHLHRDRRGPGDEELAVCLFGELARRLQHHGQKPRDFILAAPRHEKDTLFIRIAMEIGHRLLLRHGRLHRIRQRMTDEGHMRSRLPVCVRFKRKYGRHLLDIADDILRPSLVPRPDGGRDIVDDRDAQLFRHMGELHIESGVIYTDKHIRLFPQHGFLQEAAQLEEERQVLDDFHQSDDAQIFYIIDDADAALSHVRAAHPEDVCPGVELFDFCRNGCGMHIARGLSGRHHDFHKLSPREYKGSRFRVRGSGLALGACHPLILNESFARMRN